MECVRLENWHFCWNRRKKLSILESGGGYTGNRCPPWIGLFGKRKKASYWRYRNNSIPEQRKYNTQCCDDITIQKFIFGDSSQLKLDNNKRQLSGGLYITNKFTLKNDKFMCLRRHMRIYSVYCRLPHISIFCFVRKKRTADVDTMCGNTWLTVTHKASVTHYQIVLQ